MSAAPPCSLKTLLAQRLTHHHDVDQDGARGVVRIQAGRGKGDVEGLKERGDGRHQHGGVPPGLVPAGVGRAEGWGRAWAWDGGTEFTGPPPTTASGRRLNFAKGRQLPGPSLTKASWGGSCPWGRRPAASGPPSRSVRRTVQKRRQKKAWESAKAVESASVARRCRHKRSCPPPPRSARLAPRPTLNTHRSQHPTNTTARPLPRTCRPEKKLTLSAAETDVTMVGRRSICEERFRLGGPLPATPEPRDSPRSNDDPRPSEGFPSPMDGWANERLLGEGPAPPADGRLVSGGGGAPSAGLAMWSSCRRGAKSS